MNNEKINSKIKLSNNSSFVILIFVIFIFRNIGRSTFRRSKFWPPPEEVIWLVCGFHKKKALHDFQCRLHESSIICDTFICIKNLNLILKNWCHKTWTSWHAENCTNKKGIFYNIKISKLVIQLVFQININLETYEIKKKIINDFDSAFFIFQFVKFRKKITNFVQFYKILSSTLFSIIQIQLFIFFQTSNFNLSTFPKLSESKKKNYPRVS